MKRQLQEKLKLVEDISDAETKILATVATISEIYYLLRQKQFGFAVGKADYILGIATELTHYLETLVRQVGKLLNVQAEITYSFEEVNDKKNKVLTWIDELKKEALNLKKALHNATTGIVDMEKISHHLHALHDKVIMHESLTEFQSILRYMFIEYTIHEQQQLARESEAQEIYKRLKLHPQIRKVSEKLFKDGHYRNAILDSFIEIEKIAREKSGVQDTGASLFGKILNPDNPILRLNSLKTTAEKDEQRGFMLILQGVMMGIRNPRAHTILNQTDAYRTLEYLCLASLLAKRIEESLKA